MTKKKTLLIVASLFAFVLLLSPILAKGDVLVKKTTHTDEVTMMGQTKPAKDEQGVIWMTKDKMREDTGLNSTIIRLDLNRIFMIDNSAKTYSEIELPVDLEKALPPEAKQMLQMMQVTATVTDTGETQQIRGWNCKKYLAEITFSMMGMNIPTKMEMWTTKDVDIDLDLYKKFSNETLLLNMIPKESTAEFQKMEGFPVLTKTSQTMMGTETKSQEEVISVEKKDAPAGTYDLPQGLTKVPYNPFRQGR